MAVLSTKIQEFFGFNESLEELKCKILDKFNLISYKCEIYKKYFSADKDAVLLEKQNQRIFVYANSRDCNGILEIRNSIGP